MPSRNGKKRIRAERLAPGKSGPHRILSSSGISGVEAERYEANAVLRTAPCQPFFLFLVIVTLWPYKLHLRLP